MSLSGCRTQAGRPQSRPVTRVRPSAWTQSVSRAPLDPPFPVVVEFANSRSGLCRGA